MYDTDDIAIMMLLQDMEKQAKVISSSADKAGLDKQAIALSLGFGVWSAYDLFKNDLPSLYRSIRDRRWKNAAADAAWAGIDTLGMIPGVNYVTGFAKTFGALKKAKTLHAGAKSVQGLGNIGKGLKTTYQATRAAERMKKAKYLTQTAAKGQINTAAKWNPFNYTKAGKANKIKEMGAKVTKLNQGQSALQKSLAVQIGKGNSKFAKGFGQAGAKDFKFMKGVEKMTPLGQKLDKGDNIAGLSALGISLAGMAGKATGIKAISAPADFLNYDRSKFTAEGKKKRLKFNNRLTKNRQQYTNVPGEYV